VTTSFPIIERELRVAARRRGLYLSRYIAAISGAAVALFALLWSMSLAQLTGSPGRFLFLCDSVLAALYCFSAGLFWTIDCVAREKREGTLGLLFLTRLGSMDILLGKLAANALPSFFSFLTIFPLIGLAFCLGGVNAREFWLMTLALLNLLTFSLVLGLFISCLLSVQGVAVIFFSTLMLLPSAVAGWSLFLSNSQEISPLWFAFNPLYPVAVALDAGIPRVSPEFFASAILTTQGSNVVMLVSGAMIMQWSVRLRPLGFRLPSWPKTHRRVRGGLLEKHPVIRLGLSGSSSLWLLFVFGGVTAAVLYWDPLSNHWAYKAVLVPLSLHYLLKALFAWEAGRALIMERKNGFFEILLTTPVNPAVILRGKKLGLRRQLLPLIILTVLAHCAYIIYSLRGNGLSPAAWIAFCSLVVLYIDFFALSWIGLWQGLMAPNAHRAFLRTLLLGLGAPWMPFISLVGLAWFVLRDDFPSEFVPLAAIGIVSASVFGVAIGLWGLAQAHFKFRNRVATVC
jgi:hypothetical protein